jgi:hypothetical protein
MNWWQILITDVAIFLIAYFIGFGRGVFRGVSVALGEVKKISPTVYNEIVRTPKD